VLSVRFAIKAASQREARAIIGQTLASLDRELPVHGEPAIVAFRLWPGIWVATAELDVRPVQPNDPDNHCRNVAHHFGGGVTWTSRRFAITRTRRWHWRPGARLRKPGGRRVLVHPALRAVRISCEAKQGLTSCLGVLFIVGFDLDVPRSWSLGVPLSDCS
jgi:hypothetical protein